MEITVALIGLAIVIILAGMIPALVSISKSLKKIAEKE
jgi:hypothetical protein